MRGRNQVLLNVMIAGPVQKRLQVHHSGLPIEHPQCIMPSPRTQ